MVVRIFRLLALLHLPVSFALFNDFLKMLLLIRPQQGTYALLAVSQQGFYRGMCMLMDLADFTVGFVDNCLNPFLLLGVQVKLPGKTFDQHLFPGVARGARKDFTIRA
jgi:hypothetical protein